jgi:hypothetical protein
MAKATTTSGEVDTGGLANIKTIIQNVASALNVNSNRYVTTAVCVVICDIIFTNISFYSLIVILSIVPQHLIVRLLAVMNVN